MNFIKLGAAVRYSVLHCLLRCVACSQAKSQSGKFLSSVFFPFFRRIMRLWGNLLSDYFALRTSIPPLIDHSIGLLFNRRYWEAFKPLVFLGHLEFVEKEFCYDGKNIWLDELLFLPPNGSYVCDQNIDDLDVAFPQSHSLERKYYKSGLIMKSNEELANLPPFY